MRAFSRPSLAVFAAIVLLACAAPASANLLANPGFEDPITFDGPPFVGLWEGFSGGAVASAANSPSMPRSGAQSLELNIGPTSGNSFAGAFQDVPGLVAGQLGTFSGWHKSLGGSGGTEIRIEWRNSGTNMEVGRTPNFTPLVGSQYEPFSLSATVPANADTARVVYAIQSFGAPPGQQVFVDDVSFIPEPGSMAILGLLGLGLATLRRR